MAKLIHLCKIHSGVRHGIALLQLREIRQRIGGGRCLYACDLFASTKQQLVCLLQTVQQLQRREADRGGISDIMELADRKRRSG